MTNAPASPAKATETAYTPQTLLQRANAAYWEGDPITASVYVFLYQLEVQRGEPAGLPERA